MGADAWYHLTVRGLTVDDDEKIIQLLKSVSEGSVVIEDFKSKYFSHPMTAENYKQLKEEGITDKADTLAGYHCTTLQWLSRRWPKAIFSHIESTADNLATTSYINGKVISESNNIMFYEFLVDKLGELGHGDRNTLYDEFVHAFAAEDTPVEIS